MLLGSRQHWLNLFILLFHFIFFTAKQMEIQIGIVWMLKKFQSQITVITTKTKILELFFFTSFRNYWTENVWVYPFEKIDIVCKTYHANKFCVVWSLFWGVCACAFVIRFALNEWRMIRIFIRIVDFESMWFFEFCLSVSFFIYILSIWNGVMYQVCMRWPSYNDATARRNQNTQIHAHRKQQFASNEWTTLL